MIDKKEQFMLALQGWTYKGILDDIHYNYNKLGYDGAIKNSTVRIWIPNRAIETQNHKKNGTTILFLTDYTYYTFERQK